MRSVSAIGRTMYLSQYFSELRITTQYLTIGWRIVAGGLCPREKLKRKRPYRPPLLMGEKKKEKNMDEQKMGKCVSVQFKLCTGHHEP